MIYQDFCSLVAEFADYNDLPVKYPALEFDPPSQGMWLEVVWVRNGAREVLLSDVGSAVQMGIFRVMVNDQPNQNVVRASQLLESIVETIPKGTEIGNAYVYQAPRQSGPLVYDNRVQHMATWRYMTH